MFESDEETAEAKEPIIGPATIWIGVIPESTTATAAHHAAQDVLTLLQDRTITDVDVDFRESYYIREAGPRLLQPVGHENPLAKLIGPLTPTLGLCISTAARPTAQGTMALYFTEGGAGNNNLLGLSCRHVLIGHEEGNDDYTYHAGEPRRDVILLGQRALADLDALVRYDMGTNSESVKSWRDDIERLNRREMDSDTNAVDIEQASVSRIELEGLVERTERAMEAHGALLNELGTDWANLDDRVLGFIRRSPGIAFGVTNRHYTEDWGIFQIDQAKLGPGYQGNKIDLSVF